MCSASTHQHDPSVTERLDNQRAETVARTTRPLRSPLLVPAVTLLQHLSSDSHCSGTGRCGRPCTLLTMLLLLFVPGE
jgi:hypothetical protein